MEYGTCNPKYCSHFQWVVSIYRLLGGHNTKLSLMQHEIVNETSSLHCILNNVLKLPLNYEPILSVLFKIFLPILYNFTIDFKV